MIDQTDLTQEVLDTYYSEMNEHLSGVESLLLSLGESMEKDPEQVNTLFRSFHTIKGTSEMFGFRHISEFTHTAENILSKVRSGELPFSDSLPDLLLQCRDYITELLNFQYNEYLKNDTLQAQGQKLIAALTAVTFSRFTKQEPAVSEGTPSITESGDEELPDHLLTVSFRETVYANGLDPYPMFRYLNKISEISDLKINTDRFPSVKDFNPEHCYLDFNVVCDGHTNPEEIISCFEFAETECTLNLTRVTAEPVQPDSPQVQKTEEKAAVQQKTGSAAAKSFRVEADRIDRLINQISELVMAGARVGQIAANNKNSEMMEAGYQLGRIITEIRESTLRLRMVPVSDVFNRFKRVVHDMSRDLGKNIQLNLKGEDTELDKTVIEQITDPLMHLIRNSADHGIEDPETRKNRGKPANGNIWLEAHNEAGDIIIEIRDDGGGLNREKILSKAIEKGIIDKNQNISDHQILQLIFEPGLSTASRVTKLSGRGVGLDVVKRNIEALSGTVDAESVPEKGTSFRIKLPLTLATIDGLLVGVGETRYVIPLETVHMCVSFDESEKENHQRILQVNGEITPYVDLKDQFKVQSEPGIHRRFAVIAKQGSRQAGFVVDEILGEMQSVIKPLGSLFGKVHGISGSSILGNGEVALILDVHALINIAEKNELK